MNVRALFASPLIFLMVGGTRLLIVSDYDGATAVTIMRIGGVTDTSLGLAIPLLPLLLPSLFVLLLVLKQFQAAIVAALCSLLVAIILPSSASVATILDSALYSWRWYFLGIVHIVHAWPVVGRIVDSVWNSLHWLSRQQNLGWLNPDPLRQYPHAAAWWEIWQEQPTLTFVLSATVLVSVLRLRVNIATGEVAVGKTPKWFRGLLPGTIRGLAFALPVAFAFLVVSFIYPIPPTDGGVWSESLHRLWLPPERIALDKGPPIIAYPLGVKDEWQVLLIDKGRQIRYVRPDAIRERAVCSLQTTSRLAPFWGSSDIVPSSYPACYPEDVAMSQAKRNLRADLPGVCSTVSRWCRIDAGVPPIADELGLKDRGSENPTLEAADESGLKDRGSENPAVPGA